MKGLLQKDFMISKKNLTFIAAAFALLYLVCWLFQGRLHFLTPFYLRTVSMIITISFSLELFSKDDASKWNLLLLSLPATKPLLAGSRYLYLTLVTLGMGIASLAAVSLLGLMNWTDALFAHLICVSISFAFISLILPLAYRFGTQNSRSVLVLFILGIAFVLFLLDNNQLLFLFFLNQTVFSLAFAFFALSAVLLLLSYLLSCQILKKAEVK